MAELSDRQIATLMSNAWFGGLAPALRDDVLRAARLRTLESGERLFLRGQAPDGWYGVLEGAIKVGNTTPDGRESVLTWLEPGTWFGEISLFDRQPRTHDNFAYGPSAVLVVPPPDFEALLQAHPSLYRALLEQQCRRLRLLFAMVDDLASQTLELRLGRQLRNLAASYGRTEPDGAVTIDLHLPQDELAQLMGVSRQRINQALKTWERDGVLRQRYGRISIVDASGLAGPDGLSGRRH